MFVSLDFTRLIGSVGGAYWQIDREEFDLLKTRFFLINWNICVRKNVLKHFLGIYYRLETI